MVKIQGLWRGEVTSATEYQVGVKLPRLDPDREFIGEQLPGSILVVGDRVLCGFAEGRTDSIEVMRRTL